MEMIDKEQNLRDNFKQILYELAKKEETIENNQKYVKELRDLYNSDEFRHYYSDIFSVFTDIINNSPNKGDVLNIIQNINTILLNIDKFEIEGFKNKVKKLYDHLNLEASRLDYMEYFISDEIKLSDFREQVSKIIIMHNEKVEKITRDIECMDEKNKKLESKINNYQKESITILGIFTSIVITFVSAGVISSSVLENIDKVNVYTLICVFLVIGIVLFNILVSFYNFIIKINSFIINEKNNKFREYKYLIIPNVIFIVIFLFIFIIGVK